MNKKHWVIITVVLLLALASCGTDTGTTGSPAATQAPTSAPASPTATPKPTQAPKWTTVQHFSGNGTKKTQIFSVPDDWKILWSCTGGDYGGVLVVTVYDNTNAYIDGAVNATCKAGSTPTTGETEEHQAGSIYLSVDSTGDWSVQVQALK
jgi:hypothetical protein